MKELCLREVLLRTVVVAYPVVLLSNKHSHDFNILVFVVLD